MIGKNATFTCNTTGREAYWVLNAIPMTISYPNEKQAYEDQGVIFFEDISQKYYNLTMIIHASLALNNTSLFCSVIDSDYTVKMSHEVHLIIFNTLSKLYTFKSMGKIMSKNSHKKKKIYIYIYSRE